LFLTSPQSLAKVSDGLSCIIYDSLTVFNLKAIQDVNGYSNNGFRFNFCKSFKIINSVTGKEADTFAFKESADSSVNAPKGVPYTKGSYPAKTVSIDEDAVPGEPRHLSITYDSPSICNDGWVTDNFWKTNIEIFCDPQGSLAKELLSSDFTVVEDTKNCMLKISARHHAGCPVIEASSLMNWLAKHPGLAGIILLSVGFVATFFGARVFHTLVTFAITFASFFATLLIFSVIGGLRAMDSEVASKNIGWILIAVLCFVVAAIIGLAMGFLTHRYKRFGSALFGLFVGVLAGYYFHKLLFTKIFSGNTLKVIIIAGAGISTSFYSFMWSKTLTVPITAVFGAYMMIRGFSMFLGGYPEFLVDENGKMIEVENSYIYYVIAYILLLCAGVVHQRWRKYHTLYDDDQFAKLGGDDNYMSAHMIN
jgi:hypothetical protein